MGYLKHILLSSLLIFTLIGAAFAHEVGLSVNLRAQTLDGRIGTYSANGLPTGAQVTAIEVVGVYSTGEPMSGAQVRIFAPGDPSTPWQTGTLNEQGKYLFTPELSRRGRWTIRVEDAGHRGFINVVI